MIYNEKIEMTKKEEQKNSQKQLDRNATIYENFFLLLAIKIENYHSTVNWTADDLKIEPLMNYLAGFAMPKMYIDNRMILIKIIVPAHCISSVVFSILYAM